MNTKYIWLLIILLGFTACNDIEDVLEDNNAQVTVEVLPELTAGSADFSKYVAVGNSLTAGFTDSALFIAGQENSFPSILSEKFAMLGGGAFTQPLMNDNIGGIALGGVQLPGASLGPRLVTLGGPPQSITSVLGPVVSSTDLLVNNPTGPFNNMGVPGASSFHFIAPGYGNLANLSAGLANPYFIRMTGSTPNASVMEMAMAQSPSFVTLWIGANDILGYALGGASSGAPTPQPTFDFAMSQIMSSVGGVQGVMANIPNITDLPYFTTIVHNRLDPSDAAFGPQIPTLNGIFGQINQVFAFLESQGISNATERNIVFSETENSGFVIKDESLTDLSAQIAGVLNASPTFPAFVESFGLPAAAAPLVANLLGVTYGQTRQANQGDLVVLASAPILGQVNQDSVTALMLQGLPAALAGQFSVEGITLPLEDKWIVIPTEQAAIKAAIDGFNATIQTSASAAGFGLVDINTIFQQIAAGTYTSGNFNLTANLVTGGAVSLDGFHPTSRGYAIIANEFMKAIDTTYGSNFEASGNFVDVGDFPTNYSPLLP